MYSFYLFESSSADWENVHISTDPAQTLAEVREHLLDGYWMVQSAPENCVIETYRWATDGGVLQVYPHVTVKYPGLSRISFTAEGARVGGEPESGGPYAGTPAEGLWGDPDIIDQLRELGERDPEQVEVNLEELKLPELPEPLLPKTMAVCLSGGIHFRNADDPVTETEETLFHGMNDVY